MIGSPRNGKRPYTVITQGKLLPTSKQLADICAVIGRSPRGLVIAGPRTPQGLAPAIARFVRKTGYPVLGDPLSGLRWSADVDVIGGYDTFLPESALFDASMIICGRAAPLEGLEDVL